MSRRTKARRKAKRQAIMRERAETAAYDHEGCEAPPPDHSGDTIAGRGFCDPGDGRMAAHMLSLGVIPLEDAEHLYRLAAKKAKSLGDPDGGDYRGFAAMIKVLQTGAKLELDAFALAARNAGGPLSPLLPKGAGGNSVAFLEQADPESLRDTAQVLADLGIITVPQPGKEDTPQRTKSNIEKI